MDEEKTKAQEHLAAIQGLNFTNRDYGDKDPSEMDITILSQTADQMKVKMRASNQPEVEGTIFNADTLNNLKNATQTSLEQSIEALQKSNEALDAVERNQGTPIYENGVFVSTPWDADKKADKTELAVCNEKVDKKADKTQLENYYKKTGGKINGKVVIDPSNDSADDLWNEGLRINKAANGWAGVYLAGPEDSVSDATSDLWTIARRGSDGTISGKTGDLTIECGNSIGDGLTLYKDGKNPTWKGKHLTDGIYHIEMSTHNNSGSDWFYPLIKMPPSDGSTFDTASIRGSIGAWNSADKMFVDFIIGNRDDVVTMGTTASWHTENAFKRFDIVVQNDSDGNAIVYLKLKNGEYTTVDLYITTMQSTFIYNGNRVEVFGEYRWSLEDKGLHANGFTTYMGDVQPKHDVLFSGNLNGGNIPIAHPLTDYKLIMVLSCNDNLRGYTWKIIPVWQIHHAKDSDITTFALVAADFYWTITKDSLYSTTLNVYSESCRIREIWGLK